MSWVSSAHHVLGIPHLLGQFWDGEVTVLLRATRGEGSKSHHEKVKARERDQVHSKLSEIRVELTREPKAAGYTRHGCGDQMVQITNCTIQQTKSFS